MSSGHRKHGLGSSSGNGFESSSKSTLAIESNFPKVTGLAWTTMALMTRKGGVWCAIMLKNIELCRLPASWIAIWRHHGHLALKISPSAIPSAGGGDILRLNFVREDQRHRSHETCKDALSVSCATNVQLKDTFPWLAGNVVDIAKKSEPPSTCSFQRFVATFTHRLLLYRGTRLLFPSGA